MPDPKAEEIVKEAYDNVVKNKDLKLNDTILTAEIDRKQRVLGELKKQIEFLEQKHKELDESFKTEHRTMLEGLEDRRIQLEKKMTEAQTLLENSRREQNFLEQEKSNVIGIRQQLQASKAEADDLVKRVKDFASTIR